MPVRPLPSRLRGGIGIPTRKKRGCKVASTQGPQITGTAGLLTDAAGAGLVDFEDVFLRLSQTAFRLRPQVVETLRQSVNKPLPPSGS